MDSRRLDDRLTPAMDEAELASVWRRVRDAQADSRRGAHRLRSGIMLSAGVAAMAAAVALWWLWPSSPPTRSAGPIASLSTPLDPGVRLSADIERSLPMNDGSVVTLASASELEVLANEGDKFVTAVRRGRARFDVRAGGPRRWVVETDLATVEVVGTAFSVERSEQRLAVAVERGVVLVRGERVPGRVVRLTAGETLSILVEEKTAALAPSSVPSSASVPSSVPSSVPASVPAVRDSAVRDSAVRDSAVRDPAVRDSAVHDSAVRDSAVRDPAVRDPGSADTSPTVAPTATTPSPRPVDAAQVVIQRADQLLAAGKADEAAAILDAYLDDAPSGAGAGLAAFLLGRIAQDSLRDPDRAAAAFARTLQIGSPRAVQEEALARRARALDSGGRRDDAAALARDYLARFPSGAHAASMRRLAEPSPSER